MKSTTLYYNSALGSLAITGTTDGIRSIGFTEQPGANAPDVPACLHECVTQCDEYFRGLRRTFSVPLQFQGTDFQQRVWQYLLTIPFGATVSYHDIAVALGIPQGSQAIGRANGQNPIVIIVPCHRVIGNDGKLTGYGGGLWRKEWLLRHEGAMLL
jgi:methylated-DNA-[protein]-cysteine S-methyltransferase